MGLKRATIEALLFDREEEEEEVAFLGGSKKWENGFGFSLWSNGSAAAFTWTETFELSSIVWWAISFTSSVCVCVCLRFDCFCVGIEDELMVMDIWVKKESSEGLWVTQMQSDVDRVLGIALVWRLSTMLIYLSIPLLIQHYPHNSTSINK